MAYKKIDKEFCLTDNSVNCYGYRLMTEGMQRDRFNPSIGFLMHNRDKGVAVKWEDFRVEGDKLWAKPVVNESLFPHLAEQIEEGFYLAASVGHIVAIETSDDVALKLEGQTGPTVTRWFPRECSIVDIPGNYNALCKLYDERDNVLHDLSFTQPNETKRTMEKLIITAAMLQSLNLVAEATPEQFQTKLADLVARAAEGEKAKQELADLKAQHAKERVASILSDGKRNRKITNELSATLEKDYAGNPDGLKALVDAMPAQTVITDSLSQGAVPEKYAGKSFHDLYVSGELETVKKMYPDYYKGLTKSK